MNLSSYQKIHLYKKVFKKDDQGGRPFQWEELACVWASVKSCAKSYPFTYGHQEAFQGVAYELVMRKEDFHQETEKIVWQDTVLFPMSSPKEMEDRFVQLRAFSWGERQDPLQDEPLQDGEGEGGQDSSRSHQEEHQEDSA